MPPHRDPAFAWTRGVRGRGYTLITPPNRYASALPGLRATVVVKLVTPRLAPARFGQYLLEIGPGGGTERPIDEPYEHFLYGLEGGAVLAGDGDDQPLGPGFFAYLPPGTPFELAAPHEGGSVLWLKRRYEPAPGLRAPAARAGHRDAVAVDDVGVRGLARRELLPAGNPAFDFSMSLLTFQPGVALDRVEIHDEEHGLWMTAGTGVYVLDGEDHPVARGDFIYMAPYCPQTFVATGTEPAEYLLYKDVMRDGF